MTQLHDWMNEAISQTKAIYQNIVQEWKKTYTTTQEEENDLDKYMTIGDINITSEMKTSNKESTENEEAEIIVNDR